VDKKKSKEKKRDKEMAAIFSHTPYAFEACRFDRMMNPQKWFAP